MGRLEDYFFDSWVPCCEEADVGLEQKNLAEEEVKQCFERYKDILEVCGEKTEETPWQLSQSSNTKSQNLEQDLEGFSELGRRKRLGHRQGGDDKPLGSMSIRIWGKRRPQDSPNNRFGPVSQTIGSSVRLQRYAQREEAHRVAMTSGLGSRTSGEYNSTERNDLHGVWAVGFRKI